MRQIMILTRWVGAKMLLTFRLFLGAAGLVILALAVIARGLVPVPEVRTRIGEVPSVGRSLVQQAIMPPAFVDLSEGPASKRAEEPAAAGEPSDTAVALAPAPRSAGKGTNPASEPASAAGSQEARPDPIGDLVTVMLAETPSPSAVPDVTTTLKAPVPAEAPALAFAAETAIAHTTSEGGGERTGAAPSKSRKDEPKADAKAPKPDSVHENAPRHRSGKSTKKVVASERKAAAKPAEPGSLAVHVPASLRPAKAEPTAPRLEGRLLHPESLAANPREAGKLIGHSAGVLGAKTKQTHKVEGSGRLDVNIRGPRGAADVKAQGERLFRNVSTDNFR
jgi:hypothetical protein